MNEVMQVMSRIKDGKTGRIGGEQKSKYLWAQEDTVCIVNLVSIIIIRRECHYSYMYINISLYTCTPQKNYKFDTISFTLLFLLLIPLHVDED
jgi:hypothetical protein